MMLTKRSARKPVEVEPYPNLIPAWQNPKFDGNDGHAFALRIGDHKLAFTRDELTRFVNLAAERLADTELLGYE